MNYLVVNGSPRKKDGYRVINEITDHNNGNFNINQIFLSDYNIQSCKGCMLCFTNGEMNCPIDDDVKLIHQMLLDADGLVLVSPVYAVQITGQLKVLIDRLSFLFHRPILIGKPFYTIVTTGGGGHPNTQKYLKMVGTGWGGHHQEALSIIAPQYFKDNSYYNASYALKTKSKLQKLTHQMGLPFQDYSKPNWYQFMTFHGLKSKTLTSEYDKSYWTSKGWIDQSYYYEVALSPLKIIVGKLMDSFIKSYFEKHFKSE